MTHEKFKAEVILVVESIIDKFKYNLLFMTVKPLINFAKPVLEDQLEKDPKVVYEWLKFAHLHIDNAIKIFENESKP